MHVRYWGRKGTDGALCSARATTHAGGQYCNAFASATVDRRFSERILEVISPLGIEASLEAIEHLRSKQDERHAARLRKLEQLEYEAQRAFEQYDEVDPRNRLVASELEQSWNQKLREVEQAQASLAELEAQTRSLSAEDRESLLHLGRDFASVWKSDQCPMELKKKIVRTVVEEVIAHLDQENKRLRFVIHWKGGTHTEFKMAKPTAPVGKKTSLEALEVIRRMAVRYGDDRIAAVLNRSGYRTGKEQAVEPDSGRHRATDLLDRRSDALDARPRGAEHGGRGEVLRRERIGHQAARGGWRPEARPSGSLRAVGDSALGSGLARLSLAHRACEAHREDGWRGGLLGKSRGPLH